MSVGTESSWRPITSGAPSGLLVGHGLFNILSVLKGGTECTISMVAGDRELGGMDDTTDGCAAFRKDLDRLKK